MNSLEGSGELYYHRINMSQQSNEKFEKLIKDSNHILLKAIKGNYAVILA